jgi:hypothetical protein
VGDVGRTGMSLSFYIIAGSGLGFVVPGKGWITVLRVGSRPGGYLPYVSSRSSTVEPYEYIPQHASAFHESSWEDEI